MKLDKQLLESICVVLLERDLDTVEIIQFGSSVYAVEYARDLDLLLMMNS